MFASHFLLIVNDGYVIAVSPSSVVAQGRSRFQHIEAVGGQDVREAEGGRSGVGKVLESCILRMSFGR